MRLFFILAIIFMLLFAAGCGKAKEQPVVKPGAEIKPEAKPEASPAPAPPVVVEKQPAIIDDEVQGVLDKRSKVKGYRYLYYGPPNPGFGLEFRILGSKARLYLGTLSKLADSNTYDTVYLDLDKKSAVAYCESVSCTNKGSLGVNFEEYYRPAPSDFASSISSAKLRNYELLYQRKTAVIVFEDAKGMNGTMWLDTVYGMPVKVQFNNSNYEYREIAFNTVAGDEVLPKG
ncbi:hypothetical protein HYV82_04430 [Candidatus Woesearchaeota archaeon]|nr:hypothetical protein [Candidatus Woesearchaeota archaeon]